MPEFLLKEVHWNSFRLFWKETNFTMQIFVTKWMCNKITTDVVMVKSKKYYTQDVHDVIKIKKTNIT